MRMIEYIEREPTELWDGKIAAKDWSAIAKDRCIECKKKYDTSHKVRGMAWLWTSEIGGDVCMVYSAKSGYCPECAKKHDDKMENREEAAWLNGVHKVGVQVVKGNVFDIYSDGAKIERLYY